MPITSTEIAALTGGFNQQTMIGMQHSAMISNQFGGYAPGAMTHPVPTQGENITAGMMQFGTNAAMNAFSQPGMNQGFMGGVSAIGRGVLGQMSYGVQQQQMMDASMRQAFRHQNQFGGAGFTPTQLGGMQRDMMQMSMQRGPSGEQVTFEELGRLASNMGRMGMSESVRSVKDFNEKFREMLKTVKQVATDLGTSLEEAQKMMTSMKGSGVFGMGTQQMVLKGMSSGAFAGGQHMSMGELSSAALMGSQISRSIGGKGIHGEMAGVETMTQIGVMRNMGIIGEQDVYNATGMSGAEGRMALAQQDMERDARFLKSTHGRYFLASMMGKGGNLDQGNIQAMLSGGMSASDVYGRGRQNVNKNVYGFLGREGELRGQALAAGGGNIEASFYATELSKRGFDINDTDGRGGLALQYIGKMNREEADYMMKKIRNLGRMQTFREEQAGEQQYLKDVETQERKASPEDLMKDIDMARQRVNNELRSFGADLYKTWSAQVDGAIKKMSGEYERRINRNLAGTIRALERGGAGAQSAMVRDLGIGGGYHSEMAFRGAQEQADKLYGAAGGNEVDRAIFGKYSDLKAAGIDLSSVSSMEDLQRARSEASRVAAAAAGGGDRGARMMTRAGGGALRGSLREQLALRGIEGTGSEFLQNFGSMLGGVRGGDELSAKYSAITDDAERASFMRGVLNASGNEGLYRDRIKGPGMMFGGGTSRFGSTEEADAVIGRQMLSGLNLQGISGGSGGPNRTASEILDRGSFLLGRKGSIGGLLGGARDMAQGAEDWWGSGLSYDTAKSITGLPGEAAGKAGGLLNRITGNRTSGFVGRAGALSREYLGGARQDIANQLYGQLGQGATSGQLAEINASFRTDESFKDFSGLVGGGEADRVIARQQMQDKMIKLREGDMKLPSNQIEMTRMKGLLMASEYTDYLDKNNGKEPNAKWLNELGAKYGTDAAAAAGLIQTARAGVAQTQKEKWAQTHTELNERAMRDRETMEKELEIISKSDASPAVKALAKQQRERAIESADLLAEGSGQGAKGLRANLIAYAGLTTRYSEENTKRRSSMSLEELLKGGQEAVQQGVAVGAEDMEVATLGMGFRRQGQLGRGAAGARQFLAGQLGVGVSLQDAGKMKNPNDLAQRIMEESGLSSSEAFGADRRREFQSRIQEVLGSKGGEVEKAEKLASLRRDFSKDLTLAGQEKQDTKAKETDPSYRMLTTINQSILDLKDETICLKLDAVKQAIEGGVKE
jgi:hypothetical protein